MNSVIRRIHQNAGGLPARATPAQHQPPRATEAEFFIYEQTIETLFEDYKDLLGSDHYQVMSATAIVRFWTLASCLAYFLDKQRDSLQAERPGVHITWGDARRAIQAEHQRNLLVWLEDHFHSGITAGQLCPPGSIVKVQR